MDKIYSLKLGFTNIEDKVLSFQGTNINGLFLSAHLSGSSYYDVGVKRYFDPLIPRIARVCEDKSVNTDLL